MTRYVSQTLAEDKGEYSITENRKGFKMSMRHYFGEQGIGKLIGDVVS